MIDKKGNEIIKAKIFQFSKKYAKRLEMAEIKSLATK